MVTLLRDHVAVTGQAPFEAYGHLLKEEPVKMKWKDAVRKAIVNVCNSKSSLSFSNTDLLARLDEIKRDTQTTGLTPDKILSRELQELRDLGEIAFVDNHGHYKLIRGNMRLQMDRQQGNPQK